MGFTLRRIASSLRYVTGTFPFRYLCASIHEPFHDLMGGRRQRKPGRDPAALPSGSDTAPPSSEVRSLIGTVGGVRSPPTCLRAPGRYDLLRTASVAQPLHSRIRKYLGPSSRTSCAPSPVELLTLWMQ